MTRPIIYIASPYTNGDPAINVHFQCAIFDTLMNHGLVWPVAPLHSHFQHCIFPRKYEDWIAYDRAMLHLYDGCLRLSPHILSLRYNVKESKGADDEAEAFRLMGKPVFTSIEELYAWVGKR